MISYTELGVYGPVTCVDDDDPTRVETFPPGPDQDAKIAEFFKESVVE